MLLKDRIKAIVYCRRLGTGDIKRRLFSSQIIIIDAVRKLISHKKSKDSTILSDLRQVHPSAALEFKLLSVVWNHRNHVQRFKPHKKIRKKPNQRIRRKLRQLNQSVSDDCCPKCKSIVEETEKNSICCNGCESWRHGSCGGLDVKDLPILSKYASVHWYFSKCEDKHLQGRSSNVWKSLNAINQQKKRLKCEKRSYKLWNP